jgi:hypothetical protein
MTVAELIEKLKELPQDLLLQHLDMMIVVIVMK